jgi:hypothetical protein
LKTKIDINNLKETTMSSIETDSPAMRRHGSGGDGGVGVGARSGLGLALFAALGLSAAACGGENKAVPDAGADVDAGGDGPPAVLVAERVFTPDARFYYVSVLPDVPNAAIDRSKAIELTSADIEIYQQKVYIRDRFANTMTRYTVTADLKLQQDGKFSFAGVGLGTGRYSSVYVAPDRAYVMDSTGWRLIGWNPTTMALTGETISIDYMAHHEVPTGQIGPAVQVGDRLMAAIYWEDFTNLVLYPGSGALVIDPDAPAGTMPTFIEDARLGGAFRFTADTNGDAYMTGVTDGAVRLFGTAYGGGALPTSGLIKLPSGSVAFDPSYLVDVEAITQAKAVWAIHRLTATKLLVQVLDPAKPVPTNPTDYANSAEFIFGMVDTEAKTFTPVDTLPRGGRANSGNHVVDGKLYIQLSNATGSVSYAATTDGVTQAFPVPAGDVWHLQRIR